MAIPSPERQEFANDLTEYRKKAGISLRKLSAQIGYAQSYVSNVCTGKTWPKDKMVTVYLSGCGATEQEIKDWMARWALLNDNLVQSIALTRIIQLSATGVDLTLKIQADAPPTMLSTTTEIAGRPVEVTVNIGPSKPTGS